MRFSILLLVGVAVCLVGCGAESEAETPAAEPPVTGSTTPSEGDFGTETAAVEATAAPATTATKDDPHAEMRDEGIKTPSGNVTCEAIIYGSHTGMRCHIDETSGPDPPPPPDLGDCGDWTGRVFYVPGTGGPAGRIAPCDSWAMQQYTTVAYGSVWQFGPFTCLSSRLGLLCTNVDGHGVFLSREQQHGF